MTNQNDSQKGLFLSYYDQNKYSESFENYKKANDLSKKISNYNFEQDKKRFNSFKIKFKWIDIKCNG